MSYVSVEVSRVLADAQRRAVRDVVRDDPKRLDAPKTSTQSETSTRSPHRVHRVEVRDATDRAGWGAVDRAPCFVVALEVLDNLPHDRVARGGTARGRKPASPPTPPARLSKSSNPSPIR